jgi:hypothetical protein
MSGNPSKNKRPPVDWGRPSKKFMRRIVNLAHETSRHIMSMPDGEQATQEHFDSCDVMFAVWPDAREDDVYHGMCVKGVGLEGLRRTGAILVDSKEAAIVMLSRDYGFSSTIVPTHAMSGTPDRPN